MVKKKYLIALSLTVISMSLSACGNQAETSTNNQVTNNTPKVEETVAVESIEEVREPEVEVEMETEEVVESTEEIVEETVPEEPEVEMVDFDTWAKQEGNDEVCLVVWNEELGIQEIIPTFKEKEEIGVINEGDKFAIPFNEIVVAIHINDESYSYPATSDYLEVSLTKGEMNKVTIFFETEDGEVKTKSYMLK